MKIRCLLLSLVGALTLQAQEDIEKYLLTDSLQIEALVDNTHRDEEQNQPKVNAFTSLGLTARQFTKHSELNQSLRDNGYGEIPENGLGWSYGIRVDIQDHFTMGFTFMSNVLVEKFQPGTRFSSKYTYFSMLVDLGYRKHFGSFHILPGIGFGFSQSILSLKPNDMESLDWSAFFANNDLVTAINQTDFALSADLSLGKYIHRGEKSTKLLNLKAGMIFHPFSFGDPGISSGDFSIVTLSHAPSLSNTGIYLLLTWG